MAQNLCFRDMKLEQLHFHFTRLILDLLRTSQQTRPARGDETGFLSGHGVAVDGRCLSDMLVVTSSVGMVDGVHGHAARLGPVVALDGELVLCSGRLCLTRQQAGLKE